MNVDKGRDDALWERLEAVAIQWNALRKGDEAVREKLNLEFSAICCKLFDSSQLEALGLLWISEISAFDPSKGSFRAFLGTRLKMRTRDIQRKDQGYYRKAEGSRPKGAGQWMRALSLDAPASPGEQEEGDSFKDALPAAGDDAGERLEAQERIGELIALILDLPSKLRGQANNPMRAGYYRMFFTDGMSDGIARCGEKIFRGYERKLFDAMLIPFLDFFMAKPCRTVAQIQRTPLKPYGAMVEGRPMAQPGQPLPNDVYLQYLRRQGYPLRSASTISNQRDAYRAFIKENL